MAERPVDRWNDDIPLRPAGSGPSFRSRRKAQLAANRDAVSSATVYVSRGATMDEVRAAVASYVPTVGGPIETDVEFGDEYPAASPSQ